MICNECGGLGYIIVDEIVQVAYEYDYGGVQYKCKKCNGTGIIEDENEDEPLFLIFVGDNR